MQMNLSSSTTVNSPTHRKKRVAAYCRVSTLLDEQELSFETQSQYYRDLITKAPDMKLVGIYGDQGISGLKADNRPEFQRMIQDCQKGLIDVIMCKSISRFSRNSVDCANYLEQLRMLNVEVLFEKEGLSSLDTRTQLVLSLYSSIAQNESCSISENCRWTREKRAENGDPIRRATYGYRIIRKGRMRQWVVYEAEAKLIRKLYSMAFSGCDYQEMLQKTDGWSQTRLKQTLQNEAYRGDILSAKRVTLDYLSKKAIQNKGQKDQYYIEQHHEPLVSPAMFDEVQRFMKACYLSSKHSKLREKWFQENPDILNRYKQWKKENKKER